MTLKLYFMKCSGRKISQCILSFTERDKRFNHWSLQSLHSLSFFNSFPVWDHAFMTSIRKVGCGWRGGVLKFGMCLRTDRSVVHFYRWEVGWGSKNCFCFFVNVIIVWQLILKVTSIKRNVFSFILLRFKPNILHAY